MQARRWRRPAGAALGLLLAGTAVFPGLAWPGDGCPSRGVCVVQSEQRYPMDATSVAQLLKAIEDGGLHPHRRAHAASEFGLELAYVPVESSTGRCALSDLRLRLEVVLWLPEFVGSEGAPERVRAQTDALGAALRHHEEGHLHIALAHAHALLAALHALPPAADCRSVRDAVDTLQLRHALKFELAQQRYDARTGHGAAQGAVLERRRALPAGRFSRWNALSR